MALLGQVKLNLKDTSTKADVPNDPRAKLMYYLNCLCSVLKLDDNADINRLRRYQNYFLGRSDRDLLVQLCILLRPDILLNKCIFQNDSMCGNMGNKFFELEQVRDSLLITGNIVIGGQNRRVTKIMTFTMSWLDQNWTQPMKALLETQRQEKMEQERQARLARQRQIEQQRQRQIEQQRQRQLEQWRRQQEDSDDEWDRLRSTRNSSACVII